MLPIGQERVTGEDVRIPEWQLPVVDRLDQELLPGIVLQNQIGDQVVLGKGYSYVSGCRLVRFERKEVVGRQQRLRPQGHRCKQKQGQQEQQDENAQIGQCFADHTVNRSPGRRWRWRQRTSHARSAASILTGIVILDWPTRRSSK